MTCEHWLSKCFTCSIVRLQSTISKRTDINCDNSANLLSKVLPCYEVDVGCMLVKMAFGWSVCEQETKTRTEVETLLQRHLKL